MGEEEGEGGLFGAGEPAEAAPRPTGILPAQEIRAMLRALIEKEQNQAGLTPLQVRTTATSRGTVLPVGNMPAIGPGGEAELPAPLSFGQEPSSAPEWCVSYAWGDDTPDGKQRTAIVDRWCAKAEAQGVRILRDKSAIGLGERISKFMKRIGGADRVFVVLSDKYLKSPFCMFELTEVWRNSRQEDEEFLKRIRVYTLPCARIWNTLDRANYAIYWKEQYDEVEALVKTHGYDILGEADVQNFRRMKDFCRNVGDILATVADILQPRSLDELVKYGFDHKL